MAVLVECDQTVGRRNAEQNGGSGNEHPDAQITREHRNEEPVAEVSDEIPLVPPRLAGIARPKVRQPSKYGSERQRDRYAFYKSFADSDDKAEQFLIHGYQPLLFSYPGGHLPGRWGRSSDRY